MVLASPIAGDVKVKNPLAPSLGGPKQIPGCPLETRNSG